MMGNTSANLLFLPATASLSLIGVGAAEADDGTERDAILTQEFDAKKAYDKVPDDILLDRNDTKWMSQKASNPEFEDKHNAVKAYVAYDMKNNGWNEAMMKTVLITHNFDVMTGEAGNGFELVALTKSLEQLQGTYSATEPEKRFHDWVISKYDIPDDAGSIDARIDRIKDELGPDHVSQTVAAFDDQARHGNVPDDLMSNDTKYWIITANIALCDYDDECDSEFMKKVRDEKLYERDVPEGIPITRTSHPILDYFLPLAHAAWVNAEHTTSVYVEPKTCTYGTCKVSDKVTTTGTYAINLYSPHNPGTEQTGHSYLPVSVSISSCGTGADKSATHNIVAADFTISTVQWSGFDFGYGCAADRVKIRVIENMNPEASWLWSLTGTSNAYINR